MDTNIQIIEKPDWVSWDEIHDVIWKSHEDNRKKGIVMRFPSLSGEEIKYRLFKGNGKMFVALDGKRVIGTEAIMIKKTKLWCGKGDYSYLCFASVLPEYAGHGIYRQLYIVLERESQKKGLTRILFDTNEKNVRVVDIHLRHGYRRVAYKKYDNHFNILFVKWLEGCPYSVFRCWSEFFRQKAVVRTKHIIKEVLSKI